MTDSRRRIVLYDVIVSVEQPREEPTLVSHTDSTAQTGQALAEDTHIQECSHDVVGLYAHKGTMWNTDDCVPHKNITSPCGRGVLTLPVAAGGHPPAMFPVASALPIDEPQLDSWQVIVVRVDETPAGDSSEQEPPCDSQNRRRPRDMNMMNNSLNILVHAVLQGGPVGPQEKEPLALLVLDHADPVAWYAVVQKKLLHPPAMFPVASALPIDEPQLDSWQVIVVRVDETPAGDSSEQEPPCDSQNRRRPMDMNNSLNILVHTVVQGGPRWPTGKRATCAVGS